MATQNLELAGPIKRTVKGHENWYYGGGEEAYQDRQAALSSVPVPVRIGQTVGIYESGKIVEYWWNELTTDEGLVLKVEAGTGSGGGGTTTRFGIEDNLGVQDRSIDMQFNNLYLSNANSVDIAINDSTNPNKFTELYMNQNNGKFYASSDTTGSSITMSQNGSSEYYAYQSNSEGISKKTQLNLDYDGITIERVIDGALLYSSIPHGRANLPVTVNGNYADSTGNITLDLGSGGAGSSYTLPIASSTILGGIKVGTGLNIDGTGILSAIPFVETDPVFTGSPAHNITNADITNWNNLVTQGGSGNTGGYILPIATPSVLGGIKVGSGLTTDGTGILSVIPFVETDPLFTASPAHSITNGDITNWNTGTVGSSTTTNLAEGTNLYFTDARARGAISLTTNGNTGASTYNSATGVFNIPAYASRFGIEDITTPQDRIVDLQGYHINIQKGYLAINDHPTDTSKDIKIGGITQAWGESTPMQSILIGNATFLGQKENLSTVLANTNGNPIEMYVSTAINEPLIKLNSTNGGNVQIGGTLSNTNNEIDYKLQIGSYNHKSLHVDGTSLFTSSPEPNQYANVQTAILKLDSTNQGFLMPRLTTAQRNSYRRVSLLQVDTFGLGYTSAPTITINGDGVGATATPTMGYKVTGFTITNGGSSYNGQVIVGMDGAIFGDTSTATISNGVVTALSVPNRMIGATNTNTFTVSGNGVAHTEYDVDGNPITIGGSGLTFIPTYDMVMIGATVNDTGHDYTTATVTISGGGATTQATVTPFISQFEEATQLYNSDKKTFEHWDGAAFQSYISNAELVNTDTLRFYKGPIDFFDIALPAGTGGGSATRFGIEDNVSTVSRFMALGTNPLEITSGAEGTDSYNNGTTFGLYTNEADLYSQLDDNNSNISLQPGTVQLHSRQGSIIHNLINVNPEFIDIHVNNGDAFLSAIDQTNNNIYSRIGVDLNKPYVMYSNDTSHIKRNIPISVNNVFADSTGNIDLGTIGGGTASRFGIEDNIATANRDFNLNDNEIYFHSGDVTNYTDPYTEFYVSPGKLFYDVFQDISTESVLKVFPQFASLSSNGGLLQVNGQALVQSNLNGVSSEFLADATNMWSRITTSDSVGSGQFTITNDGIFKFEHKVVGELSKVLLLPPAPNIGINYIPISVNGNFADSTGNITISTGGGTALSVTTTGTSGIATYNSGTGVLNIPNYTYTLPIASASVLGGIKVGSGLSIDGTGVLSSTGLRFGVEDTTATGNRAFSTGTNVFTFNGANNTSVLSINNTGASGTGITSAGNFVGVRATSNSIALWGTGNSWGVIGESPSSATGIGVEGTSYNDTGAGVRATVVRTTGNNVTNVLELKRGTSGTPANFIGGAIGFFSDVTGTSGYQCGRLIHRVTDVTNTSVSTRFELEVYNAGVAQISFTFKPDGTLNVPRTKEFADNAAAKAGGLTDGDVYRTGDLLKMVHS